VPTSFTEITTQAKSQPQTYTPRRERPWGFGPEQVSSQRWAAGQPALTGATAGHPAPGEGWQGLGGLSGCAAWVRLEEGNMQGTRLCQLCCLQSSILGSAVKHSK